MQASPRLVLTARHNPFEIVVLVMAFLTGVVHLFRLQRSPTLESIAATIPLYPTIWGGGLVVGSTAALVSVFLALPNSLILERIGLSILCSLFAAYTSAILFFAGVRGTTSALIVSAVAVGAFCRIVTITRDIRFLEAGNGGT